MRLIVPVTIPISLLLLRLLRLDTSYICLNLVKFMLASGASLKYLDSVIAMQFVQSELGYHVFTGSPSNLRKDYIRIIVAEYQEKVSDLLKTHKIRKFALIVDGTTRVGEWLAFVYRCVLDDSIGQIAILRRYKQAFKEVSQPNQFSSVLAWTRHSIRSPTMLFRDKCWS